MSTTKVFRREVRVTWEDSVSREIQGYEERKFGGAAAAYEDSSLEGDERNQVFLGGSTWCRKRRETACLRPKGLSTRSRLKNVAERERSSAIWEKSRKEQKREYRPTNPHRRKYSLSS